MNRKGKHKSLRLVSLMYCLYKTKEQKKLFIIIMTTRVMSKALMHVKRATLLILKNIFQLMNHLLNIPKKAPGPQGLTQLAIWAEQL